MVVNVLKKKLQYLNGFVYKIWTNMKFYFKTEFNKMINY